MADAPDKPPSKAFSRTEYLRHKAEYEANRTPEEKKQRDAEASSGLQRAAEQFARDRHLVSNAFKSTTDEMVKLTVEGAQRARAQRKADMEEAFANALKKSEKQTNPTGSLKATTSPPDEIQKILSEGSLWNWEFSYTGVGQFYSSRRLDHAWEKIAERDNKEMIAAAILPSLAAVATGIYAFASWQNLLKGVAVGLGAGAITLIATFCVIFFLHWLAAPKELDEELRGDLDAARKQIAEEGQKVLRIALIAQQREEAMRRDHEAERDALRQEMERTRKPKLRVKIITSWAEGWETHESKVVISRWDFDDANTRHDVRMWLWVDLDNQDIHANRVDKLSVHIAVPNKPNIPLLYSATNLKGVTDEIEGSEVPASKSLRYCLNLKGEIPGDTAQVLNDKCVVRVRMQALRQDPNYIDLSVDWSEALSGAGALLRENKKP